MFQLYHHATQAGTLAATETGSDTAALAGRVVVGGVLSATESGADTAASSGKIVVTGTLAVNEAGTDTAALAGRVLVAGLLGAVEAGTDTTAMTGKTLVAGLMAAIEGGEDASAVNGQIIVRGALSVAELGSDTAEFQAGPGAFLVYSMVGPSVGWVDPTAAQIKAGALPGGGPAAWYGTADAPVVSGPFDLDTAASGLQNGISYRAAFVCSNGIADSNVVVTAAWVSTNRYSACHVRVPRLVDAVTIPRACG